MLEQYNKRTYDKYLTAILLSLEILRAKWENLFAYLIYSPT
jgi:hypothetical protein